MTQITDIVIRILYSTMRSLGFLTRLPVGRKWFENKKDISADAYAFPLAGSIVGLFSSIVLLITDILGFSPLAAAFFSVIMAVLLTGALHEDGLADVADAFWVQKTPQERLSIMKDSQIGTFGGLALIFVIGLRIVLVADIIFTSSFYVAFLALIAIEAASRGVMVWFWSALPLARHDGIAAEAGKPGGMAATFAVTFSVVIFSSLMIPAKGFLSLVVSSSLAIICLYGFIKLCSKKIGGYTGDTIGAIQQISIIALLSGLVIHF